MSDEVPLKVALVHDGTAWPLARQELAVLRLALVRLKSELADVRTAEAKLMTRHASAIDRFIADGSTPDDVSPGIRAFRRGRLRWLRKHLRLEAERPETEMGATWADIWDEAPASDGTIEPQIRRTTDEPAGLEKRDES